jgi:hypothetical protein
MTRILCSRCKVEKTPDDFHKNKGKKFGLASYCKTCQAERHLKNYPERRDRQIAQAKSWNSAHPERYREGQVKRDYGLSPQEYRDLIASQQGRCAICGEVTTRALDVDHDESTGTVRGLLCNMHNRGLGMFDHQPELLRKAAAYLDPFSKPMS